MSDTALSVLCGLAGGAAALLVGLFATPIGRALGLLDFPDGAGGRKQHARVTPLVGGIAVAGAAIAAALMLRGLGHEGPSLDLHLGWLAVTVAAMFAIGTADDRYHLSPRLRLILTMLLLLFVVSYAADFSLAFLRFGGQRDVWLLGRAGDIFTLVCLVGLLNAVNMADGKNGLVAGMGLIWTLVLAVHAPASLAPLLAAIGLALAVTWGFNMAGRLFLGDGGSYAVSGLFGLLSIFAYNHDVAGMRADDVAVMFAIPVFDTIRLLTVRSIGGRSPFEGDRDHLHHHLYDRWGWPRGLWVYLAIVALPNAGALLWRETGVAWLLLSLLLYVSVLAATRRTTGAPIEDPAE